jgi:hypothetical protein
MLGSTVGEQNCIFAIESSSNESPTDAQLVLTHASFPFLRISFCFRSCAFPFCFRSCAISHAYLLCKFCTFFPCQVMEAFSGLEHKYAFEVIGHSGDSHHVPFITSRNMPRDRKQVYPFGPHLRRLC